MEDDSEEMVKLVESITVGTGELYASSIEHLDVLSEIEGLLAVSVSHDGVPMGLAGYRDRTGAYRQAWFRIGTDKQPVSFTGPELRTVQ